MNLAQRVLWATVVQVAGKALGLLFALAVVKLATNHLGLDGFGNLSIVIAASMLVFVVADFGLAFLFARELAKAPERADELGGTILFIRLVTAGALLLASAIVIPLLPYTSEVKTGIAIAVAGVLVGVISLVPIAFFQVNLRLEFAALSEVVTKGVTLLAVYAVIRADLGFQAIVVAMAIGWLANLLLTLLLSRRYWRINVRVNLSAARAMASAVLPIGVVTILSLVNFRADALMLSVMKPAEDVGIYQVAFSFLEQSLLLPVLFLGAAFPIITRFVHTGDPAAHDVVALSFRFLLLASLPLALLVFVLAEPLVLFISSREFIDAAVPLSILAFAIIPSFANATFGQLMIALHRLRLIIVAQLIALTVNVGLNVIFIAKYTYVGAAATTVFSQCLGFAMVFLIARRSFGVRIEVDRLTRILLVGGLAGVAAWATLGQERWLGAIVVGVAFAVSTVALRAVNADDIRLILNRRKEDDASYS